MGLSDLREKIGSGASRLLKREDDDGAQDGRQRPVKGIGFTKGSSGGRAWSQLDSADGGSGSGDTSMLQLVARGAQVGQHPHGGELATRGQMYSMILTYFALQIFCLLVAIFINAHMTSTQKKWDVGPSGLVVFTCARSYIRGERVRGLSVLRK